MDIFEKYFRQLFCILLAVALVLYLLLIGGTNIGADEAYSLAMARHSVAEICAITAADVHPPLYYILLKFFIQPFGYSLSAAYIFSVIPYMLILLIGGIQIAQIFDKKTSLVFMFLFLFFPFLLLLIVDIRMYTLAAFFVFMTGIFAYRSYERGKLSDWLIFSIFAAAASYTHYFAMVSAGIIYLLLLTGAIVEHRKIVKKWLMAALLTFCIYLPWLASFVGQILFKVNNDYWIPAVTFSTIVGYIRDIFGASGVRGYIIFSAVSYAVVFLSVVTSRNKKNIMLSLACLCVPFGTVLVGVLASVLVRPVFVVKYVVPSLPFLVLFMAIGICQLRHEAVAGACLAIALVGGTSNYMATYETENTVPWGAIDAAFVQRYSDCDGYILTTIATYMISSWIDYYDDAKLPMYTDTLDGSSPYEALVLLDTFDAKENEKIVVFVNAGDEVPTSFGGCDYSAVYTETVECGVSTDVYVLTREEK